VPYVFVAISKNEPGIFSLPSAAAFLTLSAAAAAATIFEDELAATADDFLTEFAEQIIYKPGGVGSRSILAIVDRNPPAEMAAISGLHSSDIAICVKNDPEEGISSSEIDTGIDLVEIPVRIGETAVEKRITQIVNQDAGMMQLKVA